MVRWAKMRVSRARGRGSENSTTSLMVDAIAWVGGVSGRGVGLGDENQVMELMYAAKQSRFVG